MVENLGLRPLEVETLIVALAPHIDAPLGDVFTLLRGSPARRGVDLALVAQLFRLKRSERMALLDARRPRAAAARLAARAGHVARVDRGLRLGELPRHPADLRRAVGAVRPRRAVAGAAALAAAGARPGRRSTTWCSTRRCGAAVQALCDSAQAAQAARADRAACRGSCCGAPGAPARQTLAARIAAYAGRPLLTFNPAAAEQGTLDELLRRAQREALLRGAVLYLGPLSRRDHATTTAASWPSASATTRRWSVFGVEAMQPPRMRMDHHPLQEVERAAARTRPRACALWEQGVPPDGARPGRAARRRWRAAFHLTPGEILDTAQRGRRPSRGCGHERHGHATTTCAAASTAACATSSASWPAAHRDRQAGTTWCCPDEDMDRVREFISRSKYAHRVFDEWGFGQRVGYGKGMIALFSGPPGTGKTMLAGLIAKELDLDIYQVDLAQVVSKWVGETEKQLAKVFDQAERAHAVLLFDEADSLFAKRTEVKSSNDRYGNLAVNYLLQRLEQYTAWPS